MVTEGVLAEELFITELTLMGQQRSFDFFNIESGFFLLSGVDPLPVFLQLSWSPELHIAEITRHSQSFSRHTSGRGVVSCSLVSSPEVLSEEPEAAGRTGEPQLVRSSLSQISLLLLAPVGVLDVGRPHRLLFELEMAQFALVETRRVSFPVLRNGFDRPQTDHALGLACRQPLLLLVVNLQAVRQQTACPRQGFRAEEAGVGQVMSRLVEL